MATLSQTTALAIVWTSASRRPLQPLPCRTNNSECCLKMWSLLSVLYCSRWSCKLIYIVQPAILHAAGRVRVMNMLEGLCSCRCTTSQLTPTWLAFLRSWALTQRLQTCHLLCLWMEAPWSGAAMACTLSLPRGATYSPLAFCA